MTFLVIEQESESLKHLLFKLECLFLSQCCEPTQINELIVKLCCKFFPEVTPMPHLSLAAKLTIGPSFGLVTSVFRETR